MIHLEDQEQEQEQEQGQGQEQRQGRDQTILMNEVIIQEKEKVKSQVKEEKEEKEEREEKEEKKEAFTPKIFESETSWLCCTSYKDKSSFKTILQHLELTPVQKEIIETRYLHILQNLQKRARNHATIYFIGHFIITVGSLFVPALLSIQNSDREFALTNGPFNVHIYWATFIISLLVTMWNAILTLFRIDKKYYFLNTILERMRSEGWQYVSLTGRYSGHLTKGKTPTHKNQFIYFTHYIEKVKMKQIEEEYYRTDEKSQAPNTIPTTGSASAASATTNGGNSNGSAPNGGMEYHMPSPANPITGMPLYAVPPAIRDAHQSLRESQTYPSSLSSSIQVPYVYDPYASQGYASHGYPSTVYSLMNVSQNPASIPNPIYYSRAEPTAPPVTEMPASAQSRSPIRTSSPIRTPSPIRPPSPSLIRPSSLSSPIPSRLHPTTENNTSNTVEETMRVESNSNGEIKHHPPRFRDMRKKYESSNPSI